MGCNKWRHTKNCHGKERTATNGESVRLSGVEAPGKLGLVIKMNRLLVTRWLLRQQDSSTSELCDRDKREERLLLRWANCPRHQRLHPQTSHGAEACKSLGTQTGSDSSLGELHSEGCGSSSGLEILQSKVITGHPHT